MNFLPHVKKNFKTSKEILQEKQINKKRITKFVGNIGIMATIDRIRNNIIDKLLTISNEDYLSALYQLLERSNTDDCVKLTDEQKKMLALSEQDIQNDHLILQSQLDKEDREWLNEL